MQAISPDEYRELMEGYVTLSADNRLEFEELLDLDLGNRLRAYYKNRPGYPSPGDDMPDDISPFDAPLPPIP